MIQDPTIKSSRIGSNLLDMQSSLMNVDAYLRAYQQVFSGSPAAMNGFRFDTTNRDSDVNFMNQNAPNNPSKALQMLNVAATLCDTVVVLLRQCSAIPTIVSFAGGEGPLSNQISWGELLSRAMHGTVNNPSYLTK